MDRGLGSESDGGSSSSSRGDVFLKHLNKNSHRIAKPVRKPLPPPPPAAVDPNSQNPGPQSQQPPVYNINKNDFRDVVQKLTGSPANERQPVPTPLSQSTGTQTRGPSSRLQRIRPPPLSQISSRPPLTQLIPTEASAQSQGQQMLPPLPSVHIAAESPISAYMRFLKSSNSLPAPSAVWSGIPPLGPRPDSLLNQNDFGQRLPRALPLPPLESSISSYLRFLSPYTSSLPSPQGSTVGQPSTHSQPQDVASQQQQPPPSASFPPLPLSPVPFGCAQPPYGIGSSFLLSPTGLPPLPLSPTVPLSSPRLKGN